MLYPWRYIKHLLAQRLGGGNKPSETPWGACTAVAGWYPFRIFTPIATACTDNPNSIVRHFGEFLMVALDIRYCMLSDAYCSRFASMSEGLAWIFDGLVLVCESFALMLKGLGWVYI
jgi:hypothetical protein